MTDLIIEGNTQALTMSSREIAEVVESRHDNVRRTIETLASRGVIQLPQAEEVKNHRGQTVSEYKVCKRDSYIVVAQLSPEFTARLVDRWQELEQRETIPSWARNMSQAAQIALQDLSDQVDHYRRETERLNAVCNDLAANLREGITPAAFARMLNGVNSTRVQPMLVERKRLLKTPIGYRSTAAYRDKLFAERRGVTKEGQTYEHVILTVKGAKWLYSEYEKGNLEMKKDWDGKYSHLVLDQKEIAA